MEKKARMARSDKGLDDIPALARAIRAGERAVLARAITLIESKRTDHQKAARALVQELLPATGRAIRVGITGMPGVGKSTTIDAPSTRTGGSILGDKTRMARLAADPGAFIRPSPASGTLGGVASKTRETMLLAEAAGYDVVLVETVGIGQSEITVADMTDFFLVLMLPGAGDELQGLKKGVVEIAEMIAVNNADGDNVARANAAAAEYRAALHILSPRSPSWRPPVVTYSALTGAGIADLWGHVLAHRAALEASGELSERRREQQVKWMWTMIEERLIGRLKSDPAIRARLPELEAAVAAGRLSPAVAAEEIAQTLGA